MIEIIEEGIIAIVPQYIENKGNCTVVYTKVGEPKIFEMRINTMLKNIFKYYMIDYTAAKEVYGGLLMSKNSVPLPLTKEDVLLPLKISKPMIKNDGAAGYFNIKYIKGCVKNGKTTIIHLENDIKLECLYNENTVKKYVNKANIVRSLHKDRYI